MGIYPVRFAWIFEYLNKNNKAFLDGSGKALSLFLGISLGESSFMGIPIICD